MHAPATLVNVAIPDKCVFVIERIHIENCLRSLRYLQIATKEWVVRASGPHGQVHSEQGTRSD